MSRTAAALKRIFVGRPMSSGELEHTLLPKVVALPVFASDALSSMSYATQEVLLVLGLAGVAYLHLSFPIAIAVSVLLAIVIASYRQIVRAYPGGGGAYAVAHENLGAMPGLVVAAALLIDYVLTVAVSITAGADAIISAATGLVDHKLTLVFIFIGLVTIANLRGAKESGKVFAVPTYGFVVAMYALILTGLIKCLDACPQAESAGNHLEPVAMLTPFLVLKAFAAGTTALTGVEAIAEGVPVFRYPQSKNAATTLAILGVLSISMFIGVSWLADQTNVVYEHGDPRTVVAQVGHAVFGGGFLFYAVQVMTAAILVLAANTAYTGFPVLTSILAGDKYMPRQFRNRGDRLVLSNGVIFLALLAALLVYIFDAELNRLIQLYLIGVFLSFTLAQAGTVMRWRRTREAGWRRAASINGVGAVVTFIVLGVVVLTKFAEGAWIVIAAIPVLMFAMRSVYVHYKDVQDQLSALERKPVDRRPGDQHMVIYAHRLDAATARAVGYARSVRPTSLVAVTTDTSQAATWVRFAPDVPLEMLPSGGSKGRRLREYLRARRSEVEPDDFLTVVVPEVLHGRGLFEIFRHPSIHRLKASILPLKGVQLLDLPVVEDEVESGVDQAHEPARNFAIVFVSSVHNATLQAIEYAETLRATDVRAVTFGLESEETEKIGDAWLEARIPHPLEIEAAPFRDIGGSMVRYLRQFNADGIDRVVTVILPEFVVSKRRHQLLHGQTALVVKRHLLFERGVIVASVPFHIED